MDWIEVEGGYCLRLDLLVEDARIDEDTRAISEVMHRLAVPRIGPRNTSENYVKIQMKA